MRRSKRISRTHHNGPIVILRPKASRKQEERPKAAPVRIIVQSGKVLQPNKFKRVLPDVEAACEVIQARRSRPESHVMGRNNDGWGGDPKATPYPPLEQGLNEARVRGQG